MSIERFTTKSVLKALFRDKQISAAEAKRIDANLAELGDQHPLTAIAANLPSRLNSDTRISHEELYEWFAQQLGIDYAHIDPLKIDLASVTKVFSAQYAKQNGILALGVNANNVVVACKNPIETPWRDELSSLIRKPIELAFANPLEIDRYQSEFYNLAKSISRSNIGSNTGGASIQQSLEQMVELGRQGQLDAEDHHIVQVVDWLLQYAYEQRASDIHLEPRKDMGEIRFRIDGVLHHAYQVPPNVMLAIIGRFKILARMDIAEKRRPLDGRLKTRTPDGREIELRLSTVPTAMGEKMVMRIFDPEVLQRSFEQLGLSDRELDLWHTLTSHTNGIILVTGPTGSGKTTTLYSTLRKLASSEVNVCTIEEPIEMVEPKFNQIQVHSAIGLSFAAGVRALLRQDPDIMMIGEIRDLETAEMAIQAALTGHLVLSTLHTNDSPSAITRMLELGVPAYLISATVLGVMAQRLVRTLCEHCKQPTTVDPQLWEQFIPGVDFTPDNAHQLQKLKKQASQDGLLSLRHSGAVKVASGHTTIDEVLRVTPF